MGCKDKCGGGRDVGVECRHVKEQGLVNSE